MRRRPIRRRAPHSRACSQTVPPQGSEPSHAKGDAPAPPQRGAALHGSQRLTSLCLTSQALFLLLSRMRSIWERSGEGGAGGPCASNLGPVAGGALASGLALNPAAASGRVRLAAGAQDLPADAI